MRIPLSTTSQDLISALCKKNPDFLPILQQVGKVDRVTLLGWLEKKHQINNDDEFFLIASLHASLLKDLNDSLNLSAQKKDKTKKVSLSRKAKFGLLAIAGTIYFGCEGFDGITAVLGAFSSIPNIAFFAVGTLFSILSVIVFYSFDLVEISKNLGVKFSDAPKLLDVLLDEFKQIKTIRSRLSKAASKTQQELEDDLAIAKMLLKRHEDLNDARAKLKLALENPYLKVGKVVTSIATGALFFSGGFFSGQTVSLAIAGLFVTSIAATAWPILLVSVAVGLAAFSVYWFVERPGIENLIGRWRGLDKEKVDMLCKSKVVDRETEKLQNLINELNEKISLHSANAKSQSQVHDLSEEVARLNRELDTIKRSPLKNPQLEPMIHAEQIEPVDIVVKKQDVIHEQSKPSSHTKYSLLGELRRTKSMGDLDVGLNKNNLTHA